MALKFTVFFVASQKERSPKILKELAGSGDAH